MTIVAVSGLSNAVSITAGASHSCALLGDGTAKCWGNNVVGQLGDNSTTRRLTPVAVSGLSNAVSITAGESHSCALLGDGSAKCWGDNGWGQLGDGSTANRLTPVLVAGFSRQALVVLAFGDSVTAGHGLGPSVVGYTDSGRNPVEAFPARLAKQLDGVNGRVANFAVTGGCAASRSPEHVQIGASPLTPPSCEAWRSILGQVDNYATRRAADQSLAAPEVVVISVGANDIEFGECIRVVLIDAGRGPCESNEIEANLAALRANLAVAVQQVRIQVGVDVPIIIGNYYNPFPSTSESLSIPCNMFLPTAMAQRYNAAGGGLVGVADALGATPYDVRMAMLTVYIHSFDILGKLNEAIDGVATELGLLQARPNLANHDVCRADRDDVNGQAVDSEQVWAFPLTFTGTIFRGSQDERTESFPRVGAPVGTAPKCHYTLPDPDPIVVDAGNLFQGSLEVNCMPHPTAQGQVIIATAFRAALEQ